MLWNAEQVDHGGCSSFVVPEATDKYASSSAYVCNSEFPGNCQINLTCVSCLKLRRQIFMLGL